MTIKEVEQQTGLPRSIIRFYEKEGLIAPQRNEENRYRAYSQADVDRLVRIAFLRTLDIPLEEIRSIIEGRKTLRDAAQVQGQVLCEKSRALARSGSAHSLKRMPRKTLTHSMSAATQTSPTPMSRPTGTFSFRTASALHCGLAETTAL